MNLKSVVKSTHLALNLHPFSLFLHFETVFLINAAPHLKKVIFKYYCLNALSNSCG